MEHTRFDYTGASRYEIERHIISLFQDEFDLIDGEINQWEGRSIEFMSGGLQCWRELLTRIIGDISGGEEQ